MYRTQRERVLIWWSDEFMFLSFPLSQWPWRGYGPETVARALSLWTQYLHPETEEKQLRFTAIHYNEQLVCFWVILDEQYLVCLVWFFSSWVQFLQTGHELIRLIHWEDHLYMRENRVIQAKCQMVNGLWVKLMFTFKCMYLANAFIQSDLQCI